MSFVGIIDRIEDDMAFILMEEGTIEISVPVQVLRKSNYKAGDPVTLSIDTSGYTKIQQSERRLLHEEEQV